MFNVSLVGCAHIHTPGFIKSIQARQDVAVKWVWDHDAARAKKNADELKSAVAASAEAAINDKDVAAVVICSETDRHEKLVTAAAAARKHMFVEKPLGFAVEDAYRMADAIEKAGVLFQTGYFLRGNPLYQFLKQQIDAGTFGKISAIRHSNSHNGSLGRWFDTQWRWMADPKIAGCGAFGDVGTHALDLLMWLMGDVADATGDVAVVAGNYGDCDENGEALLKFKNGAVGSIAAGWVDIANPVSCIVSGTEAHAAIFQGQLYFKCPKLKADGKQPWTDLPGGLPHAFDMFLGAVSDNNAKNRPLVKPREAAARNAVMDAIYQGARARRWVKPRVK